MGGSNKVVTEGLCHVLVYLVMLRVEDVPSRTAHVICKTCGIQLEEIVNSCHKHFTLVDAAQRKTNAM